MLIDTLDAFIWCGLDIADARMIYAEVPSLSLSTLIVAVAVIGPWMIKSSIF